MNTTIQNLPAHECRTGMILKGITLEEKTQPDGVTKYWVATQPIDSLFGSEVEGQCQGIGKTKETALENLKRDSAKLYESIWV